MSPEIRSDFTLFCIRCLHPIAKGGQTHLHDLQWPCPMTLYLVIVYIQNKCDAIIKTHDVVA